MAQVSKTFTFSAGTTIIAAQHNTNFDTLYNLVNGALDGTNLASNAAILDTQLSQITSAGKVSITSLTVPSQATGDIIYAASASTWARLPIGTASQVLIGGTTPSFATVPFTAATQAQQETGTSTTAPVTPGRQQYHPSAAKAWCMFNGTTAGTNAPTAGYNVTNVTRNATGDYTVTFTTAFSSGNYCIQANGARSDGAGIVCVGLNSPTGMSAGSCNINALLQNGSAHDPNPCMFLAFGDQ